MAPSPSPFDEGEGRSYENEGSIDWDTIWFSEEFRNDQETSYPDEDQIEWDELKRNLTDEAFSKSDFRQLKSRIQRDGVSMENIQFQEAFSVFDSLSTEESRSLLFDVLFWQSFSLIEDPEAYDFFLGIANSDSKSLSPKALSILLNMDIKIEDDGRDSWDTWSWSPQVRTLLEEAVNEDLYKLSQISGGIILLRLFERYPTSKLVKGAELYGQISGGETYVGAYLSKPLDFEPPVLRTPIDSDELEIWSSFLREFPGHPASDDVLYRMARIHELNEDYADALASYYQASNAPDGALSDVAKERVLFIADFLMDSSSLSDLSRSTEYKELVPFLEYTVAVHLIREGEIDNALANLENFHAEYKPKEFLALFGRTYWDVPVIESSSKFWENCERQIKNIKLLSRIQSDEETDERLYQEASFWFYNQLTAYNYLWRGTQSGTFSSFLPFQWEGRETSSIRLLDYDMVRSAGDVYDNQFGYLVSIRLLEKLLNDYPESKKTEKALYSILVNYYWLYTEKSSVSLEVASRWEDLARKYVDEDYPYFDSLYIWRAAAVETAYKFVELFPSSKMADDALLTIGELGTDVEKSQALRKLISEYPGSDRIKEAVKMLESLQSES